jgi:hypothetical protein
MRLTLLFAFGLVLSLAGCSSLSVTSDYDRAIDFTQYKTYSYYGWAKDSDALLNDLDKRRIEKAFHNEFTKRGMTYQESGGDLMVSLFVVVEQKTQTTANTTYDSPMYYGRYRGYGPGWGWGPTYATTTVSTYDYKVGTLVCDVFDHKEQKLIWEGIASRTLDGDSNNKEERIQKGVAK